MAKKKTTKRRAAPKKRAAKKTKQAGSTRRKPARKKALEGNASKRKAPAEIGATKLSTPPPCPDSVTGPGVELWQKLARRLVELKLLTDLDLEALEILCDAWRRYQELAPFTTAETMFVITDRGYVVEHPAVRLRQSAINTMSKIWRQFGLTPLTRESLDIDLSSEDDDDLLKFASMRPT